MAATLSAMRTATAATRLTTDSAASDSRPTEPVSRQAMTLRVMVTIAAAMDRYANRLRSRVCRPRWASAEAVAAEGTVSVLAVSGRSGSVVLTGPVSQSTPTPGPGAPPSDASVVHEGANRVGQG